MIVDDRQPIARAVGRREVFNVVSTTQLVQTAPSYKMTTHIIHILKKEVP